MSNNVLEDIVDDLKRSGLEMQDLKASPIDDTEREACNIQKGINGYSIPYFDINGKRVPFYRTRLLNGGENDPKYKQVKNSLNHVYFPPKFQEALKQAKQKVIIITEGEKKAVLACKMGFPAIAFGGVDSWKNRSIILPKETQLSRFNYAAGTIKAQLPATAMVEEMTSSARAKGFEELTSFALYNDYSLMIIYDTDIFTGVKPAVQRAAASLGYELRHIGLEMDKIKQLILPSLDTSQKVALDDFLMHDSGGPAHFRKLYNAVINNPRAFPQHPNAREFISKKLQKTKIARKEMQSISMALIAELDASGYRMHSKSEDQMYYFDNKTSALMQVNINLDARTSLQETSFGKLLYKRYGISPAADQRLMQWLGAQFTGENPIEEVIPHRILARPKGHEDCVRYQIGNGHYVYIDADDISIKKNGDDGILFEADCTEELDQEKFLEAVKHLKQEEVETGKIPMWWNEVLGETRLKERGDAQTLLALLYYISPWLYRWKSSQLPVELVIGESGSGKSTLYELRLSIQTGRADLKNAPTDIKDWHAALANSGGLHVTDNVQLLNKALRTTLSDEICRLITEPQPHVEMRKLYSNADLMRIKVDNVFCFTAIAQPFMAADLLQRAIVVEFDKYESSQADGSLSYDSSWKERQLESRKGREYWLAHHFIVLQRFFQVIKKNWNSSYRAQHRLINFEQALTIMARDVFNIDHEWIPQRLSGDVNKLVSANDWALEGLVEFAKYKAKTTSSSPEFTVKDIVAWAANNPDFEECTLLKATRKLGIYIANSKHMIHETTGIKEVGKKGNRMHYKVDTKKISQ